MHDYSTGSASRSGTAAQQEASIKQDTTQPEQLRRWAEQLSDDFLPDRWRRVASTPFVRVAINRDKQLCFTEFLPRSPLESLVAMFRGSRALRARRNIQALLHTGMDAPECVSWGTLPGNREYEFTSLVPGKNIRQWLQTLRGPGQLQLRHELLESLGKFIGRLHACGFIHGELRPENVLVERYGSRFRCALIRNEHNVRKTPPPGRSLLRNLVQLNLLPPAELSRSDRMRVFHAWRRQMRDVTVVEGKVLAARAYSQAMRQLRSNGQSP